MENGLECKVTLWILDPTMLNEIEKEKPRAPK